MAELDSNNIALRPERTTGEHTVAEIEKGGELLQESDDVFPKVDLSGLTIEQRGVVRNMLKEGTASFSKNEDDIGCTENLQMDIDFSDRTPVLLNKQFITRSRSSYSSLMVYDRKKVGTLRLCVGYRQLNRRTVPDRHPIPRTQEGLDSLGGNSWFSLLDQGKAYHQGFIAPKSRPHTAFITPRGLYEWVRIPLCLTKAPENFQRYIEHCLGESRVPYLDIIVFSQSFGEHVEHVWTVLRRLRQHSIKLKSAKCKLFRRKFCFLGRIVSEEGYRIYPSGITAVTSHAQETSKTFDEVRQLIGFLGYYRRYIPGFSQTTKPIYELLSKSKLGGSCKVYTK